MKSTSHVREGFHTVTPYLVVEDAEGLVRFLREGLGAAERLLMRDPEGAIAHGEFEIGDSIIELGQAGGQWKPRPGALHLYVPDADASYRRALCAGGASLYEPADMFYGERSAGVEDPAGNHWYFATFQEELSRDELERRAAAQNAGPQS